MAELRIKKDKKTQVDNIDIIFALKYHDPHIHIGRKLNGELLFAESRNELQSSKNEVDSKLHGKLLDDVIILKITSPKMPLEIKIDYSGKTKEVTTTCFKFKRS